MFNVGPAEMAVLAIIAVVVFGPDRLPALAKQAAQMLRTVRDMSANARKQLSDLSPGLDESLRDLNLGALNGKGSFNAKTALQKMIFDDDESAPQSPRPVETPPVDAPSLDKARSLDKAPSLDKAAAPPNRDDDIT